MKVPGRLEMVAVDLGSTVAAGQVIARLQTTAYKLRVAQADATLRQARARLGLSGDGDDAVDPQQVGVVRETRAVLEEAELTLGRVRTFVERGISPRADLDAAEAAFKVASSRYQDALEEVRGRQAILSQRRSELELAQEQLSAAVLEAPFAGQILARAAAPGQYVDAGTPIATLVRLDPLRLRVEVPERAAPSVKRGQTVRITVEGETGELQRGRGAPESSDLLRQPDAAGGSGDSERSGAGCAPAPSPARRSSSSLTGPPS